MSATTELAGLVHDLDELEYHALPGLSSSGAKALLRSPAHYQWQRRNRVEKDAYDFGHVVHGIVLGTGLEVVVVDADDWRTKAAQEAKKAAHSAGKVPLLRKDAERAQRAADAVTTHPVAGPLFRGGSAEVSAFWADAPTGVECRGRFDYLRTTGRPIIVDLKTTQNADPARFGRAALDFGYDLQAAFYADGYEHITGETPAFLHVLVETEPPHAVSVVQLDDDALYVGRLKARRAIEVYRDCTEADSWPAFDPTVIHPVSLPRWAVTDAERNYL